MVSALCPLCKITLVESYSAYLTDLGTAVNTAVSLGANVVSNSYGAGEYSSEASDSATYYHHPGVAVVASSGDSGYGVEFPAAANDVTAVGGTSLHQNSNTGTRNATETAWSGAGSGCSAYEVKPSWQHDSGCARRTVADVSAVADPNTGVWVYDTYATSGFLVFGGTSVASPIIGSMYALAGNPSSTDNLASYPYAHTGTLNDVTSGSNGSCSPGYLCTAGPGYDGPTGLGTPNGTPAYRAGPVTPTPPSAPLGLSATPGDTTVTLSWSPPASSGSTPVTAYNVYRGTSSGAEGITPVATGVTGTGYPDTGLSDGTTYFYQVTAVNSVGEGARSTEASATPQVASVPTAPQNLHATAGNAKVTLSWSAPANTGGSPVTYSVLRGTASGAESTTVASGGTTTGYTDTGLTNGTPYYYVVKAVNATGTGPPSNEQSATPATVPGAPSLTASTSSTRGVFLHWNAPASNGGSAITGYEVYRSTSSGREVAYVAVNCTASTCTYNDSNTRSGTRYYYQVVAINGVGPGARSTQGNARAR